MDNYEEKFAEFIKISNEVEKIEILNELLNELLLIKKEERNKKYIFNKVGAIVFLIRKYDQNDEIGDEFNTKLFKKMNELYNIDNPKNNKDFIDKSKNNKMEFIIKIENQIIKQIKDKKIIEKEKNEEEKNKKLENFNEKSKKFNEKFKADDLISL